MVYVVIVYPHNYLPISKTNCPKIDSIYYNAAGAEERLRAIEEESYAGAYIEAHEITYINEN